jgi:hypothetical protein
MAPKRASKQQQQLNVDQFKRRLGVQGHDSQESKQAAAATQRGSVQTGRAGAWLSREQASSSSNSTWISSNCSTWISSNGNSACRGMAPKRASKQQQQLNVDQFKRRLGVQGHGSQESKQAAAATQRGSVQTAVTVFIFNGQVF